MLDSAISSEQRNELTRLWARYGLSYEQGIALRRKARTDLYFLAKDLLGYEKLKDPAHREVCEFFVKKDPDIPTFEEFAREYKGVTIDMWGRACIGVHDRAISLMRHGFKSTMNIADKVQWVINYPEVRISVMTDVLGLSQEFVGIFKSHFTLQSNGEPRKMQNGKPSLFQILFPEFCDTRSSDYTGSDAPEWICPARMGRFGTVAGPTIRAASAKAGKTGTHCEIAVFDDVCTDNSIGSEGSVPTNLAKIARRISMARNLRAKYGFTDYIFTPYVAGDYNCEVVAMEEKRVRLNQPPMVAVLMRPAGKITELAKSLGKSWEKMQELDDGDVEMWDPQEFTLADLKREWSLPNGRDMVATQKLLDVSLKTATKFTRDGLVRATKPWNLVPRDGICVMTGDLAYSTKERADFSVLMTGLLHDRRIYVTQIARSRVDKRFMFRWIAEEIFRQRPSRVVIEDSVGVQWLHNDIEDELRRLSGMSGGFVNIEWEPIGQGKWKRTENDADWTVRVLEAGKLVFSTGIEKLEEAYEELEVFPHPKHHDDIVSAMNLMCRKFMTETDLLLGSGAPGPESLWARQSMGWENMEVRAMQPQGGMADLLSMELPE
jgi:phage terminase large subunit-like protein